MKKFFKYIEHLWLGRDRKISLRSVGAIALLIDFIINVHNASFVVVRVLKMVTNDKTVDPALVAALSGSLAQIAMLLGIEAALIAAMLALKAYQPIQMNNPTPLVNQPNQFPDVQVQPVGE